MDLPNKCEDCEHLFYAFCSQDKIPCCGICGLEVYGLPCRRDDDKNLYLKNNNVLKESYKGDLL